MQKSPSNGRNNRIDYMNPHCTEPVGRKEMGRCATSSAKI